jgi:hypothetical protein
MMARIRKPRKRARPKNIVYRPPVLQPHFFERGVYRPLRIPALPAADRLQAMVSAGMGDNETVAWFRKANRIYLFEIASDRRRMILRASAEVDGPGTPFKPNGLTLSELVGFLKDSAATAGGGISSAIDTIYEGLDPANRSVALFGGCIVARIRGWQSFFGSHPEETAIADFLLRWMKRASLENFLEVSEDAGTAVMAAYRQMTAEHPELTPAELMQYLNWEGERESSERKVWIRLALETGVPVPRTRNATRPTSVLKLGVPSDPVAFLQRVVERLPGHTRVAFPVHRRTLQTKRFLSVLFKEALPTGYFRFENRPEVWVTAETGTVTGPTRAQAKTRFVQFKQTPAFLVGTPHPDWAKEARRLKDIDALVRSLRLKDGFFEGPQFRMTVIPFRDLEKNGTGGFIVSPLLQGDSAFLAKLHARLSGLEVLRRYRARSRTFVSMSTVRARTHRGVGLRVCFVVTTDPETSRRGDQPPLLWASATGPLPPHYRVYPVRTETAHLLSGLLNHPAYCPLVFEQIRLLEEPFSEMTAGRLLVPAPEAFSAPLLERILKAQNEIHTAWLANRNASVAFPSVDTRKEEDGGARETEWGYSGDSALFAPIVRVQWQNAVRAHTQWIAKVRKEATVLHLPRRGFVTLKAGLPGLILEAGGKRTLLDPESAGPLVLWVVQRGLRTVLIPPAAQCGPMTRFLSSVWEMGTSLLPDETARDQFARFYRTHILDREEEPDRA